jgi:ABC-2 type transport system permease protein
MINFNRVLAMFIRYFIILRHYFERLTDMFYWPALDLFIWGLTGLYVATLSGNNKEYIFVILTGLVFWIIIWRMQYEINVNILSEIWDRNIVNIFCSPLTIAEWMISLMVVGLTKMIISFSFSAILAYTIYQYNVLTFGPILLPIVISLSLTGWATGFFIGAFIVRYGQKIQTIAWTGVTLIVPFSAIYYPLSILPQWAQKIALFVPSSYVFEAMREMHLTGNISYEKIAISFVLNIPYLIFSLWFFARMFNNSRKLGLGRLI